MIYLRFILFICSVTLLKSFFQGMGPIIRQGILRTNVGATRANVRPNFRSFTVINRCRVSDNVASKNIFENQRGFAGSLLQLEDSNVESGRSSHQKQLHEPTFSRHLQAESKDNILYESTGVDQRAFDRSGSKIQHVATATGKPISTAFASFEDSDVRSNDDIAQDQQIENATVTGIDGVAYVGQMQHGAQHGQGTQTDIDGRVLHGEWKNGRIWNGSGSTFDPVTKATCTGTWVDGKMEGNGSRVSVDGYVFVGEFHLNHPQGHASLTDPFGNCYVGQMEMGKKHGQGTQTDIDGRVLYGEWKNGRIWNGSGTMEYDTCTFTGTWVNGKMEGNGSSTSALGYMYAGEFHLNQQHGHGSLTDPFGNCYVGQMEMGKKHGQGKQTYKGAIVEGEWKNGQIWSGSGTIYAPPLNSSFTGTWVNGKMEGNGSSTSDLGFAYVGEYHQGRSHGHGTRTYPNGTVHVGEFASNKPHGQGKRIYNGKVEIQGVWKDGLVWNASGVLRVASGSVFEGTWVAGKMLGKGSEIAADGAVFFGTYRAGRRHGPGKLETAEGTIVEGEWSHGRLLDQAETTPSGRTTPI